ncbi:response regulator [Roseofilum casamattae]|uniref:Response regulator n=1 Tax=Roseofilum casamattae BLCC-M143 TaxID=3022442 RepID=A0ABT7C156_9CYAN|nr:response regulator [Roseofilum casamattae]MDJ1185189.1 response regulator [Roseofilum casamattae BLCC-M143]
MRILLTEDDPILATMLKEALTHLYHVVDVADDGNLAWEHAKALTYDLILLDIDLPKLDGLSLCRRLREAGYQIPIILLTAKKLSADKVQGLDAGADDYIVKPCTIDELNARIRAVMRRRQSYARSLLTWGKLSLNPKSCEVTYGDENLSLSAKEYSLLELFLRNPQRIFSSSSILDYLWSFPDIPGEDTVRAHIKRLRRKLKAAGVEGAIETVYGMGYRLKEQPSSPENILGDSEISETARTDVSSTTGLVQQETQAAIAQIWESFQGTIRERLQILDGAIAALEQNSLSEEQREEGRSVAHKLVGSLGMFGFPQGSQMARAMEDLLVSDGWQDTAEELRSRFTELQTLLFPDVPAMEEESQSATVSVGDRSTREESSKDRSAESDRSSSLQLLSILAVDDDPLILERLQQCLSPWGLNVTPISDPHQFWPVLQQVQPQLLIFDVDMPEITGMDLCQAVRNDPDWNDLPILFFTSCNDADTIHQLYHFGADDYVLKTATDPELVTRVLNRLERYQLLQSRSRSDGAMSGLANPDDEITGLLRRYPAGEQLQRLFDRSLEEQQALTVVAIDINGFRNINREGGYRLGDRILENIAQILQSAFGSDGLQVRWGDDEFLLAIPNLELGEVRSRLQAIADRVVQLEVVASPLNPVRLRWGLARFPDNGEQLEQLCHHAENAMNVDTNRLRN